MIVRLFKPSVTKEELKKIKEPCVRLRITLIQNVKELKKKWSDCYKVFGSESSIISGKKSNHPIFKK